MLLNPKKSLYLEMMKKMRWFPKIALVGICAVLFSFTSSDVFVEDLTGTEWYFIVWDVNIHPNSAEVEFGKDGQFLDERYRANGNEHLWEANGNSVLFTVNDGYVTYKGKLTSETTMAGTAKNIKGKKWKWLAVRIK